MRPWICLFLATLSWPAVADDALRARVTDLLSGYEDPARAEDLRALPGDVGAELLAIAGDPAQARSRRQGATYALGWFPVDSHRAFLEALVASETADSHLRRSAAWALVHGWGDAAVPAVSGAFASEDVQVRSQVARALGSLGTPTAAAALELRAASESNAMVRDTIALALKGK